MVVELAIIHFYRFVIPIYHGVGACAYDMVTHRVVDI